jgi:hypothetical protein
MISIGIDQADLSTVMTKQNTIKYSSTKPIERIEDPKLTKKKDRRRSAHQMAALWSQRNQ